LPQYGGIEEKMLQRFAFESPLMLKDNRGRANTAPPSTVKRRATATPTRTSPPSAAPICESTSKSVNGGGVAPGALVRSCALDSPIP
jgi:hypothetical protein